MHRLKIFCVHTRNMKLVDDVDLEAMAHGFVRADVFALCTEATMECIREKTNLVDIEEGMINAEVLDVMAACQADFR